MWHNKPINMAARLSYVVVSKGNVVMEMIDDAISSFLQKQDVRSFVALGQVMLVGSV